MLTNTVSLIMTSGGRVLCFLSLSYPSATTFPVGQLTGNVARATLLGMEPTQDAIPMRKLFRGANFANIIVIFLNKFSEFSKIRH